MSNLNTLPKPTRPCRICRQGQLHPAMTEEVFHPHGREVRVELLTSKCDHCGAEITLNSQHDENLVRLAARRSQYGGLLTGEEIIGLRKRYGLTQQAAARIFGKGKIAFSRYENEVTYPDESTTKLLKQAIKRPEVLKDLADEAGVELPLWERRCEDERANKLRMFTVAPRQRRSFRLASFDAADAGNEPYPLSPEEQVA